MLLGLILSIFVRIPEAIPISIPISSMKANGNKQCSTKIACDNTKPVLNCGENCWSTSNHDLTFEYTFKGEMFQVYGKNDGGHGTYTIYLDGIVVAVINQNQQPPAEQILQYTSEVLPYGQHTIKTVGDGKKAYQIYKFAYWPSIYAQRLNITEFQGSWNKESDKIGGIREWCKFNEGAYVAKTATVQCSKIWVYGSTDSGHGNVQFLVDQQDHSFNEQGNSRVDFEMFKETPFLSSSSHSLSFKQVVASQAILINYIYYLYCNEANNRRYFEQNFTNSIGTATQTDTGSAVNNFQFARCRFIDIAVNDRLYYIKGQNNVFMYDDVFENTPLITNEDRAGIMWFNSNGKLTVVNCKFTRISGRGDDGCIFNCNSENSGQAVFESCEFTDCGRPNNKVLITILHVSSSIKFYDCNFTFTQIAEGYQILNLKNNNAEFDGCRFNGCGENAIFLAQNGDNDPIGVFNFTNNYVKSNKKKFINGEKLRAKPNIINNTFENSALSNTHYMSLKHNQQEIELINNTFSDISSIDPSNAQCGGLNLFIESSQSEPTIKFIECKFYDIFNRRTNTLYSRGGAFQYGVADGDNNYHTNFELRNCEFKRNIVVNHGGAICIRTSKKIIIDNCLFELNIANNGGANSTPGGYGGAIYLISTFTIGTNEYKTELINISNCNFTRNKASEGLAIYIEKRNSIDDLYLINNNFINDQNQQISGIDSNINSGIVYIKMTNNNANDNILINSCSFINNQFTDIPNGYSNIQFNIPQSLEICIENCIFELSPFYQTNGALVIDNQFFHYVNTFHFTSCIFRRNSANQGGSILINSDRIFEFTNCTFSQNSASNGGAVRITAAHSCIFEKCHFSQNSATGSGGAINVNNNNVPLIVNCTFVDNTAAAAGGGIYILPANSNVEKEICISNCTFTSNKSNGSRGHAVFFDKQGTSLNLMINEHCEFKNNGFFPSSNHDGFSVVSNAPKFEFYDSRIEYDSYDQSASGISLNYGILVILNNIYFDHNCCNQNTNGQSSGIRVQPEIQNFYIDNCIFYHCGKNENADGNIYAVNVKSSFSSINNCQFLNEEVNNGIRCGSVIIQRGGNHSITYCISKCSFAKRCAFNYEINSDQANEKSFTFQHNIIIDSRGAPDYFYCVLSKDIPCIFENVTMEEKNENIPKNDRSHFELQFISPQIEFKAFSFINMINNQNHNGGAGIWIHPHGHKKIIFTDCVFKNNRATRPHSYDTDSGVGGGIMLGSYGDLSPIDVLMTNCSFINNYAEIEGGAIYIRTDYSFTIDNCTFNGNTAGQKGGAIFLHKRFTANADVFRELKISNCKFLNNTASNGHALYLLPNNDNDNYDTCEITDNCEFFCNLNGDALIHSECKESLIISETTFKRDISSITIRPIYLKYGSFNEIANCNFINCFANENGNAIKAETTVSSLNVFYCQFVNCGDNGYAIYTESIRNTFQHNVFKSTSNDKNICGIHIPINSNNRLAINNCTFIQDSNDNNDNSNSILLEENEDFTYNTLTQNQKASLLIDQQINNLDFLGVTNCVFDGISNGDTCFIISLKTTSSFTFNNNVIRNVISTNHKDYFGYINGNSMTTSLEIIGMCFVNNVGKSLFGGGCSLLFFGIDILTFRDCHFIGNKAEQVSDQNRPRPSTDSHYYNGDGGAIQLGYLCPLNNIKVTFDNCEFIKNSAYRHGGAIAIQTVDTVDIIGCTFTENTADNTTESANLLDNHYNLKKQGRGGAIYINPIYDSYSLCQSNDLHMKCVNIDDCTFTSNKAYDGYAMYIEGEYKEDIEIAFSITNNIFNNNYNLETLSKNFSIIATEICIPSLSYETIVKSNKNNIFSNQKDGVDIYVLEVSCVDSKGHQIPSKIFTESNEFSYSSMFSETVGFTFSELFTKSVDFTISTVFTDSLQFTKSEAFSKSKEFSESTVFTYSDKFSESSLFSTSNLFSYSIYFTSSEKFSKSKDFSLSNGFTNSEGFSKSDDFSKSSQFSKSLHFSKSNDFTKSDDFTLSVGFSYSEMFSKSNYFSESNDFSKSFDFTDSKGFSQSTMFSQSSDFSSSGLFSKSGDFSKSNDFTESNVFSKSLDFTESNEFSNTIGFTESKDFSFSFMFSTSSHFTFSNEFSESNKFSFSEYFSKSSEFSFSDDFSKTDAFSTSAEFSKSAEFSFSKGFSNSNEFSLSEDFSKSSEFSFSDDFSKTDAFSTSAEFSKSEKFSFSKGFSNSNEFSLSEAFSKSEEFSFSNEFSESIDFSSSDLFTKSSDFSFSSEFSFSKGFSKSNDFSNSDDFSKSIEFSLSDYFSRSEDFSYSDDFSRSNDFSFSDEFSKSKSFSFSNDFTFSESFTKSEVFSFTDQFSKSDEFTFSKFFSKSSEFSLSDAFSISDYFSFSNEFSKTEAFSFTDQFSKSDEFTFTKFFSKSSEFSLSDAFSISNGFTFSESFTKSEVFSFTDQFSKSDEFSFSKFFSKSSEFSLSDEFSISDYFSFSNGFTKSEVFSFSDDFSESNKFSFSEHFTKSSGFSLSNAFSKSNLFTESDAFSFSSDFTKTEKFTTTFSFTESSLFSHSTYFSKSNEFSFSTAFSRSDMFSLTDGFTKTELFSLTSEFSQSKSFSKSNEFSQSKFFSFSNCFTESKAFSFSDYFSKTTEFSFSNDFTRSNSFSGSDRFSKSEFFAHSKSNEFTKTELFTRSNIFTNSIEFSISNKFSKSSEFTHSNEFTSYNQFSKSNLNTVSYSKLSSTLNSFTNSVPFANSISLSSTSSFTSIFVEKDSQKSSKQKNKTALVIGVVLGLVALIAIIIILIVVLIARKKKIEEDNNNSQEKSIDVINTIAVSEIGSTVNFSNPLYGEDNHDSRDPFLNDFNEDF